MTADLQAPEPALTQIFFFTKEFQPALMRMVRTGRLYNEIRLHPEVGCNL